MTPETERETEGTRVAVVTGGSRGIGAAICRRLTGDGLTVHLVYRDADDAAERVSKEIGAAGGLVFRHKADVSDEAQVRRLVDSVVEQDGGVHVLVNNAGVIDDRLLALTRTAQWERVLRTNLTAPFLMCRAVVPVMLEQSWGRVINISSNSVRQPGPGQTSYAASKGGLEALTRGLAAEVGHKGIRVNTVAPGAIRTDMTADLSARLGVSPEGAGWGLPEDISGLVAFLASDEADYIQGQTFTVDGGRLAMRPRGSKSGA
ncbi:SDR family NAD(P)-dependent oxidoreductase [Streptomyces sp. NPDC020681]|uniref:SDR family NAD(P)-dependent oxidoreductase n=1 Tax=Streptomyces sp. NPDC020681 TaxID=3365083 RepID=UPI0037960AB9